MKLWVLRLDFKDLKDFKDFKDNKVFEA